MFIIALLIVNLFLILLVCIKGRRKYARLREDIRRLYYYDAYLNRIFDMLIEALSDGGMIYKSYVSTSAGPPVTRITPLFYRQLFDDLLKKSNYEVVVRHAMPYKQYLKEVKPEKG